MFMCSASIGVAGERRTSPGIAAIRKKGERFYNPLTCKHKLPKTAWAVSFELPGGHDFTTTSGGTNSICV